jgi:hypothetical protein
LRLPGELRLGGKLRMRAKPMTKRSLAAHGNKGQGRTGALENLMFMNCKHKYAKKFKKIYIFSIKQCCIFSRVMYNNYIILIFIHKFTGDIMKWKKKK